MPPDIYMVMWIKKYSVLAE